MSRGKRYDGEPQLNLKKVFAVFAVILAIVLFIIGIRQIINADKKKMESMNIPLNYFSVFTNGNWGVINSSGEFVLQPANGEMVQIPNKAKPVFICTYEVNYVEGTYKTKAVNEKNEDIYTGYDNIFALQNFDENKNMWYEENILKVQKEGKFGIISIDGNEILPCEYDSIETLKGVQNCIIIKKDSKVGLINSEGKVVLEVQYDKIETVAGENKYVATNASRETEEFSYTNQAKNNRDTSNNTLFVYNENGKYGYKNKDGKVVVEAKYDDAKEQNEYGFAAVKKDGKWGSIDQYGKVACDTKYNLDNNQEINFIGKWHLTVDKNANFYTDAE